MTVINVTDATLKGDVAGPTFTGNVDGSKFSGSVTYTETVTTPPPEQGNDHGLITDFAPKSGTRFHIDGKECSTQNANKSWSVKNPDPHTLLFEVRAGDVWSTSGYTDTGNNRSEIEGSAKYNENQEITIEQTITVLPGPASTAEHCNIINVHSTSSSTEPSPFVVAIEKNTDKLQVVLQEPGQANNIYLTYDPIVRDQAMKFKCVIKFVPHGQGYARVWVNDKQLTNYSGPLGAVGDQYYVKTGIYRREAKEPISTRHSNIYITT